ncbi:Sodium/calcium exchanger protein-domain-containing protein [Lasiosphaeria miniovina]|uniref:Sodium/calcium exchanger protein-domain-containing protein n=1 Tax=Lasiosphaeria miniovina TaxID=1954250 RepID=A0AA40AWK1_9PEZI|nr:Sodium/calcium exchanger protein-domain-containing protein [Lasiosphaeria miniovina]KAK0723313.1 Sodium/calcium exchanger protein-domain-containing protein [Lasiosphaeria miniovina]
MDPPSQPGDGSSSSDPSPTDTRRPSRYESITGADDSLSESFQSTETVRRRPEQNYGSINSPTTAGSIHADGGSQTGTSDRGVPRTTPVVPVRSPLLGPDRGRPRPRKPPMSRRTSSNTQAPHRGEYFSVDDGIAEVEAETFGRHHSYISTVRRRTLAPPTLSRVHSARDDEEIEEQPEDEVEEAAEPSFIEEAEDDIVAEEGPVGETPDDDDDISDAESFTLKDRQQAINETHPFGIRLWKPALYKKDRSVQKTAEGDIHSSPGGRVSRWLLLFNLLWTLGFGWWMALIAFVGAVICFLFAAAPSGREYGRVLWGLAGYLFYPFGKFVRLEQQEAYLDEDQGEGRSISEYEQWQSGDLEYGRLFFGPDTGRSIVGRSRRSLDSEPDETESLLGRGRGGVSDPDLPRMKRRLFGRGQWNIGRVVFFVFFYFLIMPSLFITSILCYFLVFWIPMGKVTMLLLDHLRRHPLALSFDSDIASARHPAAPQSSILVCTYRAVGLKYWKYTIDGTNVFLINLMAIVVFVIFDWVVLEGILHVENFLTSPAFLFVGGLASIIPLAYFIGQAVASISAQSSMGLGAAINAFFSTLVEVFLYCVALKQGKGQLVEGSIVGSIFAGILFLPGISMCCGAIKRKTQRFNSKSAGVTSTMLLFAVIGAFGPTLFYQIYGTHELTCQDCIGFDRPTRGGQSRDCRRCYFSQTPTLNDRFYIEAVRPYCYMAAGMLFLSYIIGLWFTLRTHAAVIWNTDADEKKHEDGMTPHIPARASAHASLGDTTSVDIRDSHLYKRILGQSLRQVGHNPRPEEQTRHNSSIPVGPANGSLHITPPKPTGYGADNIGTGINIPGFSDAENDNLVHQVAEIAATAATVAARNVQGPRRTSAHGISVSTPAQPSASGSRSAPIRSATFLDHEDAGEFVGASGGGHGGHDAPNWSRLKSSIILMGATVLYAAVAEILVDTVDVVLESFEIDEKFLGITLFALVPNTTEFLNAISFAMNGNIALSMEIGSAYALQVCLLQIPALVLFSAIYPLDIPVEDLARYTFTLLFPQWDMVTVILCVFLLSYMYGEGKSNYFKGSILLLSYMVVVIGYYFSSFGTILDGPESGISRFDTLSSGGEWISSGPKPVIPSMA